jgi:hypothetical protein
LPVSFDDLDEAGPSDPHADNSSLADLAGAPSGGHDTSTLEMVHSCSRIGLQASPLPGFSGWLRRR